MLTRRVSLPSLMFSAGEVLERVLYLTRCHRLDPTTSTMLSRDVQRSAGVIAHASALIYTCKPHVMSLL